MWRRVRALFRAELAALSGVASLVSTAAAHGLMAALLGGIVRSELELFGFAIHAFAVAAGLLCLPLVGEVGTWFRTRPAAEWMASLPARAGERGLARLGVAFVALGLLSLGSLLPLALMAPGATAAQKLALFGLGLVSNLTVGALLLAIQALLAPRRPNLLLALQTTATAGVAAGLLLGLPLALGLAGTTSLAQLGDLARLRIPSAVFAAPFADDARLAIELLWIGGVAGIAVLLGWRALAHAEVEREIAESASPLDRVLRPLERLARRLWLRPDERAGFDFVYAAMPRERETALRTYPLLAVPLLFAWVAYGMDGAQRESFLALLLFTPGFYLPVLLAHVPASSSHAARWTLDTAPLDRDALERGAFKAVAVRYVLPLHVALGLLAWQLAGLDAALRLAFPATFVSLLVLRPLYRVTATDLPLSIPPEEAGDPNALTGPLMMAGIGLAVVAMLADAALSSPIHGLVAGALLLVLELRRGPRAAT